jgi:hypothetical protein
VSDAEQQRKESVRKEVRRYLAERPALAFRQRTIRERLNSRGENDFTDEEVRDALANLLSGAHVAQQPDPDGATKYYKITREGALFHERNP